MLNCCRIYSDCYFVSQYKNIFVNETQNRLWKYELLLLVAVLFSWMVGIMRR